MENMRNVKIPQGGPAASRLVRLALIGGAGLYAASNSLFNVEGGHRAIVFNRLVGIKEEVRPSSLPFWSFVQAIWLRCRRAHRPRPSAITALLTVQVYEEGTHFLIPWFERPVIYDVRTRPNTITSTSGSKDLQMVRAAAMLPCTRAVTLLPCSANSIGGCNQSSSVNLCRSWC